MIRNRFELSSIITKFFVLIFIIVFTPVSNAASLDPSPIVNGISSICPRGIADVAGIPGPIEIFSSSEMGPVPIVSGDEDANPSFAVVGVASTSGNGRIVALGHDGFFINFAMSLQEFDNKKFGINIINWLQNSQSNKKVLITTGHGEPWVGGSDYEDFRNALEAQGYDVVITPGKITSDTLSGASILFMSCAGPSLEDDEIRYIQSFVNRGGGLFMQGLGWSWVQYQHLPLEDCPMNKLAKPYGFRWIDGYISDSEHNNNGAPIFSLFYPNQGKILNVPYFNQGNTNWCYLNCLSMLLQYYGVNKYPWDLASRDVFNKAHDVSMSTLDLSNIRDYVNNIQKAGLSCDTLMTFGPFVTPDDLFTHIQTNIDRGFTEMYMFMDHVIVVVGYDIENGIKHAYIHDPSGKMKFQDRDQMFIRVPIDILSGKMNDWGKFVYVLRIKGNPEPPKVNFYIKDENIIHLIEENAVNRIESSNYLNRGNKYVTDKNILLPSFLPALLLVDNVNWIRWYEDGNYIDGANIYNDPGTISIDCSVMNPNDFQTYAALNIQVTRYDKLINEIHLDPIPVLSGKKDDQANYIANIPVEIPIRDIGQGPCTVKLVDRDSGRSITSVDVDILSSKGKIVIAKSPVWIEVIDPDGLVVNKSSNNTEGMYYIQKEMDNNTDSDDIVVITMNKIGLYKIIVFPKPNAELNDIYTLEVYSNGTIITLAKGTPIRKIPDKPYSFEVTDDKIVQPLTVEKIAFPTSTAPGASINFTINITNTGTMTLNHVQVIDRLPDGLSYISDNRSGEVSDKAIAWNNLPSLDKGKSIFIQVVTGIDPKASGNLTNLVEVTAIRATEKQEEVSNSGYSTVRVVDVKEPKVRQNVERTKIGNQVTMATGNGRATNNIKVVSD